MTRRRAFPLAFLRDARSLDDFEAVRVSCTHAGHLPLELVTAGGERVQVADRDDPADAMETAEVVAGFLGLELRDEVPEGYPFVTPRARSARLRRPSRSHRTRADRGSVEVGPSNPTTALRYCSRSRPGSRRRWGARSRSS